MTPPPRLRRRRSALGWASWLWVLLLAASFGLYALLASALRIERMPDPLPRAVPRQQPKQ